MSAPNPEKQQRPDPGLDPGPRPESRTWVERDAAVVWHGFTQMGSYAGNAPLVIERAEGRELIDADGRRYLDAISSLWVNTLGHRVPELDAALVAQAGKVAHSTMLGNGNTVVVELAETLAPVVPVDDPHFLFAADGAVAVEQALKIAFQYWVNRGVDGRTRFLALGDAYHGDSIGALSLGDGGVFSAVFDPLCFPVVRTPGYADPGWADKACAAIEAHGGELAAVVIEPLVQGASGMLCASASDVRRLGEACRQAGTLLICDEVATGFGRTGTLFASEQCGVRPDLMCVGKGITGGYLAMSATVASGEVFGAFLGADLGPETFYHGHSYGGNALAAAVALEHLRLIEAWDVLGNVRSRADQLSSLLGEGVAGRPEVREVRQRGLMVGVELHPPAPGLRWGRRVCAGAVARGVLLRPLGDVVVLMPPLTTTAEEIVRIVDALDGGLDDLAVTTSTSTSAVPVHMTNAGHSWDARIRASLERVVDEGRWRAPREFDALGPAGLLDGGPVVSFASNDYLGLSAHPAVVAAAQGALARWGAGSGASRLVTGSRPVHTELERELAAWKGTEAAVCFPTGFAANLGVLSTLGGPGVRILSDELNHASIIDGCRLSRSALAVYRHRDMGHLAGLLAETSDASAPLPTIVVTDSVFSMDGDTAPLDDLVTLCRRHHALLVLDEAHAVLGPDLPAAPGRDKGEGLGGQDRDGVQGGTVVRVGTMSKTLGSLGGFVAASRDVVDLIVNRARSYIFSTAPTPADAAAALTALRLVRSAEGAALTGRLAALIERVTEAGFAPPGHPSPIIPIVLGSEQSALNASAALLQEGLWVPAIRPPTVPVGTSRLRVTLSAAHRDEDVSRLLRALAVLPAPRPMPTPASRPAPTPAAL